MVFPTSGRGDRAQRGVGKRPESSERNDQVTRVRRSVAGIGGAATYRRERIYTRNSGEPNSLRPINPRPTAENSRIIAGRVSFAPTIPGVGGKSYMTDRGASPPAPREALSMIRPVVGANTLC